MKLKLEWFEGGKEFDPKVEIADYRAYAADAKKAETMLDLAEARGRFIGRILGKHASEPVEISLTIPQIQEAFDAVEGACFPGPRLCPSCRKSVATAG